ncbi:MAG: hypothetical protein GY862_28435 [Gammaproteobacteria bacterium]|nr:hypothetical protein [Gammaproteobacteria bacterium]
MTELQDCMAEIQSDVTNGISINDSVMKLHDRGISVVSSVRIIKKTYELSLAEAKELVANHHVWNSLTESVKPFHDDLIDDIRRIIEKNKSSKYDKAIVYEYKEWHSADGESFQTSEIVDGTEYQFEVNSNGEIHILGKLNDLMRDEQSLG